MDRDFELVGEMGLLVRREVAAGFRSRQEIIERAVRVHRDEAPPRELRALAEELAGHAFHRHLEAQRGWPLVTDCDRLDIAFARLLERGIVARQNCADDGPDGIEEEVDRAVASGQAVRGYAYYRLQDTEAAVEGLGLFVDYGARGEDDDDEDEAYEQAGLRIGHEVADVLRQQGLVVDWDGSAAMRISVRLEWKRRRPWSDEA